MSINVNIPEDVLYDTKMTHDDAEQYIRRIVALTFYTQNGVSLGYCSEIAGISKFDFVKFLRKNGISIFSFDNEVEFLEDMYNA